MKEQCRINNFSNLWMSGVICLLLILVCLGNPNGVMAAPKVAGPTGLTASLNSVGDGAALTWSASELLPDGYLIERSQSATKDFSQILAVSGSTTSVVDSPEAGSGTYYYRVRSYATYGSKTYYSSYTNVADVTVASDTIVSETNDTAASVAECPAPVINSVTVNGDSYELSWSMPSNPYGVPDGGYDIVIDGNDTGTTNRTTATSTTINGFDTTVAHTFIVEARWTQVDPAQFMRSSAFLVSAMTVSETDDTAPSVVMTAPSTDLNVTSAQTVTLVAAASDNVQVTRVDFYDGTTLVGSDTTNTFSASLSLAEADNGTHAISAVAYDAAGNSTKSASVNIVVDIPTTVEITPVAEYPAPVFNSVTVNGDSFVLNWSMPSNSYGTPDGGYDIVIDGVDTGTTNRTTQTSTVITGLDAGVEHSFLVEARWLQADPDEFPRSDELRGIIPVENGDVNNDSVVTESITDGPLKAFPGAEGFGTETPAGRGGQIIKVTNLNDSGSGSLREALAQSGPRIIVFEVAGVINLSSSIVITNPFVTIAGQSAPAPGITLNGYGLQPQTHDILIQHLFIRITSTGEDDGMRIYRGSSSAPQIYNVVIDHVSLAWGNDENASVVINSGHDFTYSNCLIGEGHYGLLIDANIKNVSVLRNLIMSATARHPRLKGGVSANIVNNVLYNCGNQSFAQVGSADGKNYVSFAGNNFIDGPDTSSGSYGVNVYSMVADSQLYMPTSGENRNIATGSVYSSAAAGYLTSTPPVLLDDINVLPAEDVEFYIYNNVGARPAERSTSYGDFVDERFISELQARVGSVIDRIKPDWVKPVSTKRVFDVVTNPNGDDDGDGYTNIEEQLYEMALTVEGRSN